MIPQENLQAIALEIKAAQDECRQIETLTSRIPGFNIETAYRISEIVHDMRTAEGYIPAGRKIGFTNPEMWDIYGVREPIWAYVYDKTIVHVHDGSAVYDISRFSEPKIEPEIVLHFHSPPPPKGGLKQILDSIDWIAHGIEIVQSHFPGWKFQAADAVSDWSLHGTLLVGEPIETKNLGHSPFGHVGCVCRLKAAPAFGKHLALLKNQEGIMKSYRKELWFNIPKRRGFVNITRQVEACLEESGIREGLVLVNAMHITASVFINDDESGLHHDYEVWLEKLAPHEPVSAYRHNVGEDNADAHMKRQIMGREVVVAVTEGELDFGTWERIFYGEFDGRRRKRVLVKIIGE